jgi:hypothetical protein
LESSHYDALAVLAAKKKINPKLLKAGQSRWVLQPERPEAEYHNYIHGFNYTFLELFGLEENKFFSVTTLAQKIHQHICSLALEFDEIMEQDFIKKITAESIKKQRTVLCLPTKSKAGYCNIYSIDFRSVPEMRRIFGINYHKENFDDALYIGQCYFDGNNFQAQISSVYDEASLKGFKKVLSKKEESFLLKLNEIIVSLRRLDMVTYNISNAFGPVPIGDDIILIIMDFLQT